MGENTRHIVRAAVVAAAIAGLASGCSSSEDTSATDGQATSSTVPDSTSTSTAAPFAFTDGARYVSIGSSIASGFGIANQEAPCGRSDRSYAFLIAAEHNLDLVDVSCGAAAIPNVIDTPQGANPPQIEAVTPDTELITIGLGGNDIGYNGTAVGCGNPDTVCTPPPNLEAMPRRCLASSTP